MNAEETLIGEAEKLGCSIVMVDDRPVLRNVRVRAIMVQATSFADTINREVGRMVATVERKNETAGPVWVRIGSRAYEVAELRAILRSEGHVTRFARRMLADNGVTP